MTGKPDRVDALLDQAERQPFVGWDFSWLRGRLDSQRFRGITPPASLSTRGARRTCSILARAVVSGSRSCPTGRRGPSPPSPGDRTSLSLARVCDPSALTSSRSHRRGPTPESPRKAPLRRFPYLTKRPLCAWIHARAST